MKKLVVIVFLAFILILPLLKASAQDLNGQKNDTEMSEQDGTYDVPDHPNLKVRVFVHKPKPALSSQALLVCNLLDPDSSATVSAAGWHLPSNWTYSLNLNSVPNSVGRQNLPAVFFDVFSRWSSATNNKVTFVRGLDTTVNQKGYDGKNIVAWGRTSGSALAVTYTWYYPSTGLAAEVDTIMNKKFSWSWTPYSINACVNSSTYDAQDILTHELGHWLGLDDKYTSDFVNNTMYGYGSKGEIKKDTLTSGDIAGVSAIYK